MTKAKIIGICASVAAVATIAVTVILLGGEEAYRILKVFEMNGTGNVERQSTVISAYEGMKLENEDTLSVGNESTVRLSLDDNKYILLDQNTVMSFEAEGNAENSRTKINLVSGAILNEVTEALSSDSIYEVNTPKATMAVRGTSFYVEVIPVKDDYLTKLSVLHGTVSIQLYDENGNPKGSPVSVTEGFSVAVFTENGMMSAESAKNYGDAYFVFLTDEGYTPVASGENPLFELEGELISEAVRKQALKSDKSGLLQLKIAVADELRGETEQPEQTTTAATEAPVSETTTTAATTAETTTTTTVADTTTVAAASVTTAEAATTASETTTTASETTTSAVTTTTAKNTERIKPSATTTKAETTTTTAKASETTLSTTVNTTTTTAKTTITMPVITALTPLTTPIVTAPTITTTPAPVKYTVEFCDENGDVVYSEEVEENGTVSYLPEVPAKTGYTGEWDYDGSAVTGDLTITAVYTINTYTVTYSLEGYGDTETSTQQYEYGTTIVLDEIPDVDYYTNTLWLWNNTEYAAGASVTVESDMDFVVTYTPVKVQMQVMLPNYSYGSSYAQYDTITIDYGKKFSENDRGFDAEGLLEYYDNPHTLYPTQMIDTWSRYTAVSAAIKNTYGITSDSDPIINSDVVEEGTDGNGNTVYTTTIYITYGYKEFTVTYKIEGYGSELDENGYGVYTTATTTYENYYSLIAFPTDEVGDGYWSDEIGGTSQVYSLYVGEDVTFYGVLST